MASRGTCCGPRTSRIEREVLIAPVDGAMVEHEAGGLGEVGTTVHSDNVGLVMLGVELVGEDENEVVTEDGDEAIEDEIDSTGDASRAKPQNFCEFQFQS
ncbi:hypothetical protein B296_00028405 [Ensete ventricosum]|uniref:Uncharacterized protein n=1 Tax=Ensete ventricosum TaxID=4639 RepID=A0A426XRU0_ENSVE|nr:hypothetical protein B296_00028405 [Ensete ventricosum]